MKSNTSRIVLASLALFFVIGTNAFAEDPLLRREGSSPRPGSSREELNAKSIIDGAIEALNVGQNDRGVKALQQVAKQYPDTKARFRAWLLLGEHFFSRRNYEEAIVELKKVATSEDADQVSTALCQIGICHYEMNAFDQAVAALRQVINKYPGSAATNDAYYYIGMCHYHRKRWGKALQAFEMVGTSVADREDDSLTLAEAGRRLFIRIRDKDLPVLDSLGKDLQVKVTAGSGDSEQVPLEAIGRADGDFVASVRATTEPSQPDDGLLRVRGSDKVLVTYIDENTEAGEAAVTRLAEVQLVSTAGLGVTDGAFRQRVAAVAIDQPIFIRLKDLDLDTTEKRDEIRVKATARYKMVKEDEIDTGEGRGGVDLTPEEDRIEWIERSNRYVTLIETAETSGLFVARILPKVATDEQQTPAEGDLVVRPGDVVVVQYIDGKHLRGEGSIEIAAEVLIVETGSPALENMVTVSSDPDIQARKLLLEAQLRQMLAKIFHDMGLVDRAIEKSNTGLERVDEILKLHASNPLSRHLLERAFEAKWNLYLAQGDVKQAIATCRALLRLVPDTALADQAFLKIGQAYYDSDVPADVARAIPVLQLVIDMEGASGAPEASLLLANVYERQGSYGTSNSSKTNSALARSVAQAMKTAELFPDSPQAAEALKKVVKYHYERADYPRTVELLERICQDYQDQEWLHKMLLTWGVVQLKMNRPTDGIKKLHRVIEEYPESDSAETAATLLEKIRGEEKEEPLEK